MSHKNLYVNVHSSFICNNQKLGTTDVLPQENVKQTVVQPHHELFFFKFIYLIYLFLAALGLRCCAQAFFSCGEQGLVFTAVRGLLVAVASLVAEHGL